MAMYHSWDSQNAWLRQIHAHNHLFVNPTGRAHRRHRGRRLDVGRVAVGQGALPLQLLGGGRARHGLDVERDRQGIGRVASRAGRQRIAARLPAQSPDFGGIARRRRRGSMSNSDPVTGQAAWYDVRVRIYPADEGEPKSTSPQFAGVPAAPGTAAVPPRWQAFFAGRGARK